MAQKKTSKAVFAGLESGMRLFKWTILLLVVLFWFSGITSVKPGNVGMVMRFGRLVGATLSEQIVKPGLVLAFPYPIDEVVQVPEMKIEQLTIDELYKPLDEEITSDDTIDPLLEGYAITGDMNVIQTQIVVKYKVVDPIMYRLGVSRPEDFIRDIVLASFTQTASLWRIDDILRQRRTDSETESDLAAPTASASENAESTGAANLTGSGSEPASTALATGKNPASASDSASATAIPADDKSPASATLPEALDLEQEVLKLSSRRLDDLNLGIEIIALEFREIHPPRHVNKDFENVRNAKIEIEEAKHNAEKYARETIPAALAEKNALVQGAKTYQEALRSQTEANFNMFKPAVQEYRKEPDVVRQRVYLETIEQVFDGVGKLRFIPPETKVILSDEPNAPTGGSPRPTQP